MSKTKTMKPVTFKNYEPLMRKLAFKFAQRLEGARVMGVDVDDVMGHLSLTFVNAARSYKPESGFAFSTYLTTACVQNFNHLAARLIKEQYGVERETDPENRTTTTRGLGYCSIEVMHSDDEGVLNLYDMTEDETYAGPEDALQAKQVVRDLMSDDELSPHARIYLMSVINPGMELTADVRAGLRRNHTAIRRELTSRFGVDARHLKIGVEPRESVAAA